MNKTYFMWVQKIKHSPPFIECLENQINFNQLCPLHFSTLFAVPDKVQAAKTLFKYFPNERSLRQKTAHCYKIWKSQKWTILGQWNELKTAFQDITTSTWAVIIKPGFYDFFIPRNQINPIYYLNTKVKQSRVSIKITHTSPISGKFLHYKFITR